MHSATQPDQQFGVRLYGRAAIGRLQLQVLAFVAQWLCDIEEPACFDRSEGGLTVRALLTSVTCAMLMSALRTSSFCGC